MTAQVISFTHHRQMARREARDPERKTMHTLVFRSREVILEVDEATLLADVRGDLQKAEKKLAGIRRQLENFKLRSAAEIERLTAVSAKLGAAVDVARRREA